MPDAFTNIGLSPHVFITFWIMVGFVLLAAAAIFAYIRSNDPYSMWDMGAIFAGMAAAIAVAAFVIALVPFDAKYHHLYRVTAQVESVSNTLTDGGGELTSTPIVNLADHDFDIAVNDPRINNLAGSTVTFTCGPEWVYLGADRFNCVITEVAR